MNKFIKSHFIVVISGFFLFAIDRLFKYLAYKNQDFSYLWKDIIGWEFYANSGIAFSLPFPDYVLLVITPIILLILVFYYFKKKNSIALIRFGFILIILGAISNYIDRILFSITIDYLKIFTGIINLADLMIAAGVLLILLKDTHKK